MSTTIKLTISSVLATTLLSGCGATKTVNIDLDHDREASAVMGLDYRDFQSAAQDMVASLISSGAINKPNGGRYVLVISNIINDTMQHIDTDLLVKKYE